MPLVSSTEYGGVSLGQCVFGWRETVRLCKKPVMTIFGNGQLLKEAGVPRGVLSRYRLPRPAQARPHGPSHTRAVCWLGTGRRVAAEVAAEQVAQAALHITIRLRTHPCALRHPTPPNCQRRRGSQPPSLCCRPSKPQRASAPRGTAVDNPGGSRPHR